MVVATLAMTTLALREALYAARRAGRQRTRFRDVTEAASDWICETGAVRSWSSCPSVSSK